MSCSLEQRQEALDLEKKRIAELAANGADVSEMEELLNFYQENIDKPVRIKNKQRQYNKQFKDIPARTIAKMNSKENDPRSLTGAKLTVKSGYTDRNGRASYVVTYPNNSKEYTIGAHAIIMNNMDAQHSVSETLGSDSKSNRVKDGEVVLSGNEINNFKSIESLLEELDSMDNIGTSDEHKTHIMRIAKHLVNGLKKPVQEMNVYLSDKYAKNHGFIEFKNNPGIYLKRGYETRTHGTDMSLIETFVHELVHGATHYGFKEHKVELSRELILLSKLRRKALEVLTPEDLMGDVVLNEAEEYKIAEDRLDYMAGENGLEEFMAMALSNEKIFNKLKGIKLSEKKKVTTLWDSLSNAFTSIMDSVFALMGKKERTMQGDKLLMKLVSDIGKLNHEAEYVKSNTYTAQASRLIDAAEEKFTTWFDNLEKKNQEIVIEKLAEGENLGLVDKMRAIQFVVSSEKGTPVLQNVLSILGLKQEGSVQTILRHMKHADEFGNIVQSLTLASSQVDMHREHTATTVAHSINKVFKGKMTKARKKALYIATMVAGNDTLVEDYSEKELLALYKSDKNVDVAIARVEENITKDLSIEDQRYMLHQAKGLATLMLEGISDITQRKNAQAIVTHVLLNDPNKATEEMVNDVDRLVSLYALKRLDKSVKTNMMESVKNDYAGVKYLGATQKGFMEYMNNKLPANDRMNLMKNYHRETFDSQIDRRVEATDRKTIERMRVEGYTLAEKLPGLGLGYDNVEVGLYVSDELIRRPMNRSSLRYLGDRENGDSLWQDAINKGIDTGIFDIVQEQVKRGNELATKYEEEIRQGKTPDANTHVVPVVNENNEVVDYRTEVPLKRKLKHLGLVMNASMAVARSQAHEADLEETEELNAIVWDELIGDMVENVHTTGKIGKNGYEYVDITKLSDIDEVKDAASILPENIRKLMNTVKKANSIIRKANREYARDVDVEEIEKKFPKGLKQYIEFNEDNQKFQLSDMMVEEIVGEDRYLRMSKVKRNNLRNVFAKDVFKVRRDMLLDVFGVRDASISNLIPTHKYTRIIKKTIRKLEDLWKEIVKIFKVDVIIRTLPVLVGNIVSNLMYSIQYGLKPWEVVDRQIEGIKLLQEHIKGMDRLAEITSELLVKPGNKALIREMNEIKDNQRNSPIKPLIDAGMYQHIVEDVNIDDLNSNNRIARFVDDHSDNIPELVKTGGHWLFMSEKTSIFQLVAKMTAYSDFVARYSQYTLGIEKGKKRYFEKHGTKMPADEVEELTKKMMINVRDAFVNYSKPDSKLIQYMNDMGFIAFSKYAIRIQLGIQDLLKGKPLRFMLAAIGQELMTEVTGYNPDDIVESSFLHKDPSRWLYIPGAEDIIKSVVEPHSFRFLESTVKGIS